MKILKESVEFQYIKSKNGAKYKVRIDSDKDSIQILRHSPYDLQDYHWANQTAPGKWSVYDENTSRLVAKLNNTESWVEVANFLSDLDVDAGYSTRIDRT